MTTNGSTPPPRPGEEDPAGQARALASTLAGLAREMEQIRRDHAALRSLIGRVDELTAIVRDLAATVAVAKPPSSGPSPIAPCWLDFDHDIAAGPGDPTTEAEEIIGQLGRWIAGVYLRYSDAKMPDCWLWHPDIVEELLWLHAAWLSAYDPGAPATAVGDWHDRQRPGVVGRIKAYAGFCSLEAHQPGQDRALPAPTTPTWDAIPAIATWWATGRDQPGPAPTAEQMQTAGKRIRSRGHR